MPTIRVAVCTNRPPAAVAACLEALALQAGGLGALLVTSGLDEVATAAHGRALAAALPGAEVLREPRAGLSRARNRALAACADDEVLAFVDDDALVGPRWLERLQAAWAEAPERVACIGGPIRPRFPDDERPAWLADALLPALTVLDYGPEPLDLDPFVRTVYGANVAFRCGPLRAVGGFDEAFGHDGGRAGFGEEDEAERALARAGYAIRYVPDAWVWHVIPADRLDPRALAGRRFRYGATLGRRHARTRAHALRQGVSSALGTPVALARGDRALAAERAVRAAENAGVLLAPLVGRR